MTRLSRRAFVAAAVAIGATPAWARRAAISATRWRKDRTRYPQGIASGDSDLSIKRGVRAALEYASSGDVARARAQTNPDLAPRFEFVDMGGHGYAVVTAAPESIATELVSVPRPITRAATPDGGPLRYRVTHTAARWRAGERPVLRQQVLEGDAALSL